MNLNAIALACKTLVIGLHRPVPIAFRSEYLRTDARGRLYASLGARRS